MDHRRAYLKWLARSRRQARKLWQSNSGDWQWLAENPAPIVSLNRVLWRESVPSLSFFVMLMLSGVISTLGLLTGSAATVIGAMIIAPLIGPILGLAYSIAAANRRLMKRSSLTLAMGVITTVLSAALICQLAGLTTLTEEIILRTRPTLLDLMVALAAGAAGAFAKSRKFIANAFPGVAIAVALVPPLSVIGIGIVLLNPQVFVGSLLLFATNLTGIIFSGIVVFLWQEYGSFKKAQSGIVTTLVILAILGVPLGLSMRNLIIQSNTRQYVQYLIRRQVNALEDTQLRSITVDPAAERLSVNLELTAPIGQVTTTEVQAIRQLLQQEFSRPVELEVRVVPVERFVVPVE